MQRNATVKRGRNRVPASRRQHLAGLIHLQYRIDPLEPRLLLSSANNMVYDRLGSPLQATEYSFTSAINVSQGAVIPFDMQVQGEGINGITPTGQIDIYLAFPDGETTVPVNFDLVASPGTPPFDNPSGNPNAGVAVVSGTITLPAKSFSTATLVGQYLGDSFYESLGGYTIPVNIAATNHLAFIQNPSDSAVGDSIRPAITVAIENAAGNIQTDAVDSVTLALGNSMGTGALTGTLTASAAAGVATFSAVSISATGQYRLAAADGTNPAIAAATSDSFNITGGKLVFLKAPTKGDAGTPLTPAIRVALEDSKGNIITTDSSSVVTLLPIDLTAGFPITGNTATLVRGMASFSNVVLSKPGFYVLQAADGGDTTAVTGTFKVSGDKLIFKLQPKKTVDANNPIPVKAEIVDSKNAVVTDASSTVVLSLNTVGGGINAQVMGTTSLAFTSGIAYFNPGPTITKPGTYTFTATEEDFSTGVLVPTNTTSAITTTPFAVGGYQLKFVKKPVTSNSDERIPFSVDVEDGAHRRDKTYVGGIQLSLAILSGDPTSELLGFQDAGIVGGLDTAASANAPVILNHGDAGIYTLTATAVDANGTVDPIVAPAIFTPLKTRGDELVFVQQPLPSVNVTENIAFKLQLKDGTGHNLPAQVVVDLSGPPEAVTNFTEFETNLNGVITFITGTPTGAENGLSISKAGTYQLGFSLKGTSITAKSKPFKVMPYHLAFIKNPTDINYGDKETFTVAIEDSRNNINTSDDTTVITASTLVGATDVTLSNGEFSFNDQLRDGALGTMLYIPGKNYSIHAFAITRPGGLTPVIVGTSKNFAVNGFHLQFVQQPAESTKAGALLGFIIALRDSKDHIVDDNIDQVEITVVPESGSVPPQINGPTTVTFLVGQAAFGAGNGFTILTPGRYGIMAVDVDGFLGAYLAGGTAPATSDSFTIS